MEKSTHSIIKRIAFIGNYLPRQCGIAIFTTDLCEAIADEYKGIACIALPVNDTEAEGKHFIPVGSNGFYQRGGERARFDQQPVEAQAMVSASLEAHRITGKKSWHTEARRSFEWFLGRNDLHLPVYDPTTGGCRDGLHPDRPNENQGAESTLAFLQSLLELRLAENIILSDEDTHIDHSTLSTHSTTQTQPYSDSRELVVSSQ